MSFYSKIIFVVICFLFAAIGFLNKIPAPLRGHDKLLHILAYFIAAAFLNYLFKKRHLVIFMVLFLFGVLIEYLQQLANKITHSHIHGRFDIEDVYANTKGLLLYSFIALVLWVLTKIYTSFRPAK